ncbi:MAG: HAD-IA family hydrolase [Clostridia bacterium]|nr:HAD-IA family hydrolase [Clostridia bacterium]
MKKYEFIFFDFDGTLVDTTNGTMKSALYALKKFNIDASQEENIGKNFSGVILKDKFKEYGLDENEANEAVKYYREYQSNNTITCNEIYPGIKEILSKLKENNKKIIIVTGKLEETTKKILDYLNILNYFDLVVGATSDNSRVNKNEIMKYAISQYKNLDFNKAIMIGDRPTDIKAGSTYNMDTIGVLYGMGNKESFENLNVTHFIKNPIEMLEILI